MPSGRRTIPATPLFCFGLFLALIPAAQEIQPTRPVQATSVSRPPVAAPVATQVVLPIPLAPLSTPVPARRRLPRRHELLAWSPDSSAFVATTAPAADGEPSAPTLR